MANIGPGRRNGRVKFFNSVKGYGFIIPHKQEPGENVEIFVHHTAIHNNGGFKSLAEGEEVEYDLMQGPKGLQASNVTGPGGVSVKGDPNAGKQSIFGQFGGFGGATGHGGYMQAYSQPYFGGQPIRQPPQYGAGGGGLFQASGPSGAPLYGTSLYSMYTQPPSFGSLYGGASQALFCGNPGAGGTTQSPAASAGFPAAQAYGAGPPQPGAANFSSQAVGSQSGGGVGGVGGGGSYHNFYGPHSNAPVIGGVPTFFYAGAGSGGLGTGGQPQQ